MDFKELKALRLFLLETTKHQVNALKYYHDARSNGFSHRYDGMKPGSFSKASSATCVVSLIATSNWHDGPWGRGAANLADAMLDTEWASAKLPKDNPFTVAFILEAVTVLDATTSPRKTKARLARLQRAESILRNSLRSGAASIQDYPPSAYLTQLVSRVLAARSVLSQSTKSRVDKWAWDQIDHQLALSIANSQTADVFQLAYSIILVASLTHPDRATPDQTAILDAALDQLFQRQLPDGRWPRSRPLFHYPGVGSAYCFEYEMLVQLIREPNLRDKLLRYLPNLSRAARALTDSSFRLGDGALAWSSGHHPQLEGPESWSTASVYHFVYELGRLTAEAIRRAIFEYLNSTYTQPREPLASAELFAPKFLDCEVTIEDKPTSLRQTIFAKFVKPIATEARRIEVGGQLSANTPMSAILFGPPGTSKTELTKQISDYLRWPHLTVDPSHFMRNGMDQLQTEADKIFDMLAVSERVVVLLDEVDEMVRARDQAPELLSRFLTTSMLPKLATINKNRKIVFIVATNYIDHFDFAISRPGRFDIILQVMPPTAREKLRKWADIRKTLGALEISVGATTRKKLAMLTYDECNVFQSKVKVVKTRGAALKVLETAWKRCTLNTSIELKDGTRKSWTDVCEEQQARMRLL